MSTIDERIVSMKFNNTQFEQGIKTTLSSLEALNKGLKLEGAAKGLSDVSAAASKFSLAHISEAVDGIANKFSAMGVIAITTLANITNRAIAAGTQMVKSLTIDPVMAGLREYETNLNSIQTILSNTQWENKSLEDVNKALAQLNHYSDQTIYNFSEMARNIGTFTAAGVKLDTSVNAIKGIANLAAISGSNANQASAAMYQLSQALAAGKVSLEDWNSVVNSGMGGKVFQDALMETARVHGVAIDRMVKDEGSFRMTLQKGWLTSEILTETLSKFTGDLTAQQLKAMGYNDQQIAGIIRMGQTAQDAATKVKTFSQLMSTLQEAAGSGWAQTWQLMFGDFEEAKSLFTDAYTVLVGFINASSDARNKVIGDWKELGGRTVLIEAISNAFHALINVIKPIKDAFREIFPATTGKQLYDLTVTLRDFTAKLKMGGETADKLKRTFAGVFAVFSIVWDVIKGIVGVILRLVGVVAEGTGGFLGFTAKIGDFLVKVRQGIKDGNGLTNFFKKLGDVLVLPIEYLKKLGSYIKTVFGGSNIEGASQSFHAFLDGLLEKLKAVVNFVKNLDIVKSITSSLKGMSWGDILSTINTGLFAGLALSIGLLIKNIKEKIMGGGDGDGFFSSIKDTFESLTNTMESMQNTLRATTLLAIAAAIGVLTISVVALSKIDAQGLTNALLAITIMFTQLGTALYVFEKYLKIDDIAKMYGIAGAMVVLGIAINILASAVKKLAELDWQGLAKGLGGVIVLLGALTATVKLMPDDKKLISSGIAMVILAGAIKLLVSSVTDLSGLSWEEMAKGLGGVAALLGALTLFTKITDLNKGGLSSGIGLLLLATGVKVLASAMEDFSSLSWQDIAKGIVGLAGSLTFITGALDAIPPTAPLAAAGILITALALKDVAKVLDQMGQMSWGEIGKSMLVLFGSLTLIAAALDLIPPTAPLSAAGIYITALALKDVADVLDQMGQMSWGEIGRAMVALAGSLLIIGVAVTGMILALPGAAALLVVAAALRVLQPVLKAFGEMSLAEVGTSLLMLAGVFLILGVAGLVLGPIVPILFGLGIAVALLGVGMLAAGVGVLAFAAGLTLLSMLGVEAANNIVAMVGKLLDLIPMAMQKVGEGIIAFANVIATSGPAITAALVTVLLSLITAIEVLAPKIIDTLFKLLLMLLETMNKYVPKMVDAGLKLLTGILDGIANNIGKVVKSATDVVVNFIDGISNNLSRVIQAGVNLIINFVNGLADAIRNNSERMGQAGANLATAIIEGMVRGLSKGIGQVASKAKEVAKSALEAAMNFLDINSPSKKFMKVGASTDEGFALGIDKFGHLVTTATKNVGKSAIDTLRNSISGMSNIITGDIDMRPTITPLLDLTDFKRNASQIGSILTANPLLVETVYSKAKAAAADYKNNQGALAEAKDANGGGDNISFTQINNSPKSLSSADIYRQTKNQLSVAKGVLTK